MSDFSRYAVYYLPEDMDFVDKGAAWLGWDAIRGREVAQPGLDGLPRPVADLTKTPGKYGLHATLKPPFRLTHGQRPQDLCAAVERLAATLPPVRAETLEVAALGHFIALRAVGDQSALGRLAGALVTELDHFRAPPGPEDLARRRAAGLTAQQEALLLRWGYPYVLEEFRFHITLTGRVGPDELADVRAVLAAHLGALPAPFVIRDIAVAGERPDGRFQQIRRYTLNGPWA
ncbi:MAG: DUF1045 domain-containing protein [Pseudomonadota bacterium]